MQQPSMQQPLMHQQCLEQQWMERLLRCAARVGEAGEVPVAAVLLDGHGRAIGWGSNRRLGSAG